MCHLHQKTLNNETIEQITNTEHRTQRFILPELRWLRLWPTWFVPAAVAALLGTTSFLTAGCFRFMCVLGIYLGKIQFGGNTTKKQDTIIIKQPPQQSTINSNSNRSHQLKKNS